jgi:hypothetical protein
MTILFPLSYKNYNFSCHVGGHIDPQCVHVAIQASDCHVANVAKTENWNKKTLVWTVEALQSLKH